MLFLQASYYRADYSTASGVQDSSTNQNRTVVLIVCTRSPDVMILLGFFIMI